MLRVLELYCGLGGCAVALGARAQIVAAVDIHRPALAVYARNLGHPTVTRTLESIPRAVWRQWEADLWWLSPPCQPYTRRGRRRDLDDPRAGSLLVVLERLAEARPALVAVENVPGFFGSRAYGRVRETLAATGYAVFEGLLCPTALGVPNRRQRFFLVGSRRGALTASPELTPPTATEPRPPRRPLQFSIRDILDAEPRPELIVPPGIIEPYAQAIHVVDPADPDAVSRCFTSAYGRSPVRSGSYLRTGAAIRRFSPAEILRLLGFPPSFTLPPQLCLPQAWSLVGNSLSVPAVRQLLEPFV